MKTNLNNFPKFYIVSTPIGNLKDITFRAIEILKEVDIILCEDTTHTVNLLAYYNIKKKLISYHKYTKDSSDKFILKLLNEGKKIALVCDAGTPMIADPGNRLVKFLIKNNIKIEAIPGVCSIINALVLSGACLIDFVFAGWMPKKSSQKTKSLLKFFGATNTVIFLESPHRIKKTIETILQNLQNLNLDDTNSNVSNVFNKKSKTKYNKYVSIEANQKIIESNKFDIKMINVCIAREMTKMYEELIRGNLIEVNEILQNRKSIKGEIVIIFEKI
ncbi:MAG: 16S rRNA (cytidine(1402)-2'-O)-methyltransferase [Elusimicrobiota bacterium]|jgi:16S rRNA (cytidine1402-2'-O)-methyltransferase|nr:16S rRNA (cytidine(1402)-2'-O)-methyltransferase [Elusimicrobiota bacterium]